MCSRAELSARAGLPPVQRLALQPSLFPRAPSAKPYQELQSPAHRAPAESNQAAEEQSAAVWDLSKRVALEHYQTVLE
jgi:hypothetical protein